jgi:hypothetical protein
MISFRIVLFLLVATLLVNVSTVQAQTATPPPISFGGGHGQSLTIPIPTGTTAAIINAIYSNFDGADIAIAQGTSTNFINQIDTGRSCTGCLLTIVYNIDQTSPLQQLTIWLDSQSPFSGDAPWTGTISWNGPWNTVVATPTITATSTMTPTPTMTSTPTPSPTATIVPTTTFTPAPVHGHSNKFSARTKIDATLNPANTCGGTSRTVAAAVPVCSPLLPTPFTCNLTGSVSRENQFMVPQDFWLGADLTLEVSSSCPQWRPGTQQTVLILLAFPNSFGQTESPFPAICTVPVCSDILRVHTDVAGMHLATFIGLYAAPPGYLFDITVPVDCALQGLGEAMVCEEFLQVPVP